MTYTILRFAKQKGNPAHMIQAHHERQKEKYFSNPDIRTEYSQYNIHLIKPQNSYRRKSILVLKNPAAVFERTAHDL